MHRFDFFCLANKTVRLSTPTSATIDRIEIPLRYSLFFKFQLNPFFRIDFDTDNNV
jgi:hypothetical protein